MGSSVSVAFIVKPSGRDYCDVLQATFFCTLVRKIKKIYTFPFSIISKFCNRIKKQTLYPLNKYMNPCNRFYSYRAISSKSGIILLLRKRLIKKNIALITPPVISKEL